MTNSDFICGALEGFYGRPWKMTERLQLIQWIHDWNGLNTYMYAPKDDLYHRSKWRELYPDSTLQELKDLIDACYRKNLRFIYAVAPGLDITYSSDKDWNQLLIKMNQIRSIGSAHFAILFDDIPSELSIKDQKEFSSFAQAQATVTNRLYHTLQETNPDSSLIFCPTVYCGRMADFDVVSNTYLNNLGQLLDEDIGFFWTGPEVVSREIPVESIRELRQVIRRKPIIWDNIHANDYDIQQIFFGPYAGRPPELKEELSGILSNPNCQFWANFNPLRTLDMYSAAPDSWDPRRAYLDSSREWLQYFGNDEITKEEIILLGDCFYIPGQLGEKGIQLVRSIEQIMGNESNDWGSHLKLFKRIKSTLNSLCTKLMATTNRDLLYDFYLVLWELREEIEYVSQWIDWKLSGEGELKSMEFVPRRQGILNEIKKIVHQRQV